MNKLLEHLYYQTPKEYEMMLSGPEDPHLMEITGQRVDFKKHLTNCSLQEYCQLIIKAFLDIYPKTISLEGCLLGMNNKTLLLEADRPLRAADVQRADFIYKKAMLKGRFDPDTIRNLEYLDELKITFKNAQPLLAGWIGAALSPKPFTSTMQGSKTIFEVQNSPILKAEVDTNSFSLFIDKNSFIEYIWDTASYLE
jgi:hypothetical protein